MTSSSPLNAKTPHEIMAAFDIGSNSIKMTLAWQVDGSIQEFGWASETVRLGQGVDATGTLASDRIAAGIKVLRRFSASARQQGASRLLGVATEATRTARNGQAFLDRVTSETGIELTAISGAREAELTFLGLDGVADLSGEVIVADIGGGSTEIILATDRAVRFSHSFPVGSGRLTERFVDRDPPLGAELDACRAFAEAAFRDVPFASAPNVRLLITGGTGEYSFRMIPEGTSVNASVIDRLLTEFTTMTSVDLAQQLTIAEARAKVLPAGVAVVRAIIERATPMDIRAAKSGIRRGLLLAAFAGTI